ncbi:MAG TPA: hypothetical protein DEB25_00070 [Desulfobulbaceae bacterium]|nr:hypothetical protein [Desulfobulbaceae bacterium]
MNTRKIRKHKPLRARIAPLTACIFFLAMFLSPFATTANAQVAESHFRAVIGYKTLTLTDHSFRHDTHPDDSFLPDAAVPGSAGTTDIGSGLLSFLALGGGYQTRLSKSMSFNIDAGCLFGGNRSRRQNANDIRPPEEAVFVYSETKFGAFASMRISYYMGEFSLGAEAQYAALMVDAGWDRYGSDERQSRTCEHQFSAGPKVGYDIGPLALEGTFQFGQSVAFGLQLVWKI